MESASCKTTVTELDTKEIVPNTKLVPMLRIAADTNVSNRTGTSAHVCDVSKSTTTTITATQTTITLISEAIVSDDWSPSAVET